MKKSEMLEKKFSIVQEISSASVVADNISTIANLILDLVVNYTDAEKGSLMLLNDREELSAIAARGIDPHLVRTYRAKLGEGIAGTVALNRQAVLVEDIEKDERFRKSRDRYSTRSFMSCPIMSKNRLLGILNVNDKKDGTAFTEDEFSLIKVIADQAALALENNALMNRLRAQAAELDEINKKLMDSDALKTESITHISHELRTPLNPIKGAVYYLQSNENLSHAERMEFYTIISAETDKLISIVENLLDYLRLEDETRIIRKSVVDLGDLLEGISGSKLLKLLLSKKNLSLETRISPDLSDIVGDKMRVEQLFLNLLEGLSPYLESEDRLALSAAENDTILVTLSLPRPLPESDVSRLFQSRDLFRARLPEDQVKIYLARKVAELHGWRMSVQNAPESFAVSLSIPRSIREKRDAIIDTSAELFIEFVSDLLGLNVCSIMLADELTGELTIRSARGLAEDVVKHTRIRYGDRIAGWVAQEGKPVLIEDIETDPRFGKKNIAQYSTHSLLSIPLKAKDRVIGVLNLNNKKSEQPFTKKDMYVASVLAERVSHFFQTLYAGEYRERDFKEFTDSFGNLLDAEKQYHKKKERFPILTMSVMDRLGVTEKEKMLGLYVSMLYDLGLVSVDESVRNKKTLLSSEARTLRVHPYTTLSLLGNFEFSQEVKNAILHHHEKFDGTGYPDGLGGEDIPFLSRVIAVVDSFCAMTTERPYRDRLSEAEALGELQKGSGTSYDPRVVAALEEVLGQP